MSHLMLPHGLNQNEINTAYLSAKDSLIGLDFITVGHRYTVLYSHDDSAKARYVITRKIG